MKFHLHNFFIFFLVVTFLVACGPSQADIASTSTLVAANIFATQTAMAPTDTSTPMPTDTATPLPFSTPVPSATPNLAETSAAQTQDAFLATRHAEYTATAEALAVMQQAVDAVFSQLVSDGAMTYSPGDMIPIDDFEESWAQRSWYQWWWFGYNISDFVLMSHIDWEIPENSVWGVGGCGFIARLKDVDNHLVIFLSPKGNAELGAMTTSGFNYQGYHWQNPDLPNYTNIQPALSGSADIVLVVEKEFVTVYVDGVRYYQWYVALTSPGDIAYTIVSGTNKDYGIDCSFTDTRIWELIKQ